ncbi:MAG: RRXRR domain-containing protein [Deltaproteobacteria bacterium]|nr:RRXRR domain-containing protein [Deltaproteobacteria bacterium]
MTGPPVRPRSPKRARLLLERGRPAGFRLRPFTIILKDKDSSTRVLQPLSIKIDPGSKTTSAGRS